MGRLERSTVESWSAWRRSSPARDGIVALVRFVFENDEDPAPCGSQQPRFDRLEYEGSKRFFLVGKLATGEAIRIRLTTGRYEQRSASSP